MDLLEEEGIGLGLRWGGCSEDGIHEVGTAELAGLEGDVVGDFVEDPLGG